MDMSGQGMRVRAPYQAWLGVRDEHQGLGLDPLPPCVLQMAP